MSRNHAKRVLYIQLHGLSHYISLERVVLLLGLRRRSDSILPGNPFTSNTTNIPHTFQVVCRKNETAALKYRVSPLLYIRQQPALLRVVRCCNRQHFSHFFSSEAPRGL